MKARVIVTLKAGVLDPQGKAIEGALGSLGIEGVAHVRQGKIFDVELDVADEGAAKGLLRRACERLLANTVIENYRFEIDPAEAVAPAAAASEDPAGGEYAPGGAADAMQEAADDAEMPAEGHP